MNSRGRWGESRRLRVKARGRHCASAARGYGLTLVELLLSMMMLAMIGAATASMLHAAAYGTQSNKDMREVVVRHKSIDNRIGAAIRSAARVLSVGDDHLVLWIYDVDGGGAPNLAEIRRIEWDEPSRQLLAYRAPDDLDPANNTQYALSDNFDVLTSALRGGANFPETLWATDVVDWMITLNDVDAQQATMADYRVTIRTNDISDVLVGAAALRN